MRKKILDRVLVLSCSLATAGCVGSNTDEPGDAPGVVAAELSDATTATDAKPFAGDLSVQFISRLPRFPKSEVQYEPPAYNPHLSPESASAKQWPDRGDHVSFVAHVVNQGGSRSPAVRYRWLLDGQTLKTGELHALAAGQAIDVSAEWSWQDNTHGLLFELLDARRRPLHDQHDVNNALEQRTNAIMFTIYAWPGFDAWMAEHENAVGTRSGADWIQFEASEMNRLFRISKSDLAPDGVRLRIAIDRIVHVPGNTPYSGGHIPPETCPTEACWSFGGPDQGLLDWLVAVKGQRDQVTMHEWGHQLGLIDLYQMDVQDFEVLVTSDRQVQTFSDSSAGNDLRKLFDGDFSVPIVTYEGRPVWFALEFAQPRQLDEVRMSFDGYVHDWQVFSADTLAEAVSMTAPATPRTPIITTVGQTTGVATFPSASAKVWLVRVERTDGDHITHVDEMELYDQGVKLDIAGLQSAAFVAGTPLMPVVAADVIRYNSIPNDLMSGGIQYLLSPYHAWALNTDSDWQDRGLPLRRGWFGRYLAYVPPHNVVSFTRFGAPVANSTVEVFQQQDGIVPDVAKYVGKTDTQGRFVFPEQTTLEYASTFGLTTPLVTANPFSTIYSAKPNVLGTNGVLLFRVTEPVGVSSYTWLDVPQFNLEYARGHRNEGHYTIEVASSP